ncbi:hypothetical protein QR680_010516 [Steinernema hermaphroditum]|uniref:Uncharacterized protein n=1 Tax=Steinernema hermaphroditum TaxID=289476 RepID=A0AA39MAV6_9BILA|nr:hypothetical protein QR680_010516 [Steinernema hermaphroditum]
MQRLTVLLAALLLPSVAVWIGEDYWASINHDGSIREGRTRNDFLQFDAIHQRQRVQNAYVAFWITADQQGHYEAFGHAWVENDGRVCGRFVGRFRNIENICGGFRVLARHIRTGANPFRFVLAREADVRQAVTYRRRQIAKITSWQKNEAFFGGVSLNERSASGIDYDLEIVELNKDRDPYYYENFVQVLVKDEDYREPPQPENIRGNEEHYYHSDRVNVRLRDDVVDYSYEPQRHQHEEQGGDKQRYLHRPPEEFIQQRELHQKSEVARQEKAHEERLNRAKEMDSEESAEDDYDEADFADLDANERQRRIYNAKLKKEERERAKEKAKLMKQWEEGLRMREASIKKQNAGVQILREHEDEARRRFAAYGHW